MIAYDPTYETLMTPDKISQMVDKVRALYEGQLKSISVDNIKKIIIVNEKFVYKFSQLLWKLTPINQLIRFILKF